MARPKADLPPAQAIRALADAQGRLAVRVTPGTRAESIEIGEDCVLIKVRARPQDGAANDAVRKLLARALGIAASGVILDQGASSRVKRFRLADSG